MMVDVTDLKQAEEVALRLSSILEQSRTAKVVPLDVRRSERQPKTATPPDARTLFLAEIARLAPTQREPRALASAMLRQLAPQYELDLAVLALERFAGSEIVATLPEADAPRPHADCDLVARLEEAEDLMVVPTAATRCPEVTRDMSSLQILPLRGQDGRRVGALAVATRRAESFDDEDRAELRWYADQMGRWLAFASAYETLSATSTLDPLTGLLTRDAFYLRFAQEVSRATRSDQRLALLRWSLWDAPDDARITEVAARAFGEVLKAELRPYDVVARLGAREFVALVFVRNHEIAHNIAGRVQQHAVRTSIGRGRFLEVPARGFALFPDDANQLDGLDRIAEVRLANHRETRRSLIGGRSNGRSEPQAAG
jgi:GGDEF domain-containing protein